jgi:hypothetical protein
MVNMTREFDLESRDIVAIPGGFVGLKKLSRSVWQIWDL